MNAMFAAAQITQKIELIEINRYKKSNFNKVQNKWFGLNRKEKKIHKQNQVEWQKRQKTMPKWG